MPTNESIADLAHRLWIARGRPHGSAEDDWLEAERQLSPSGQAGGTSRAGKDTVDSTLEDTFPASDPPASHLKDVPPANAAEKWRAAEAAEGTSGSQDTPVDEADDLHDAARGDRGEGP